MAAISRAATVIAAGVLKPSTPNTSTIVGIQPNHPTSNHAKNAVATTIPRTPREKRHGLMQEASTGDTWMMPALWLWLRGIFGMAVTVVTYRGGLSDLSGIAGVMASACKTGFLPISANDAH